MGSKTENCVLVFDVGKTHIKVTVLDKTGAILAQNRTKNKIRETYPYDSFDTERSWKWLISQVKRLTLDYDIQTISLATHGAAAALVDRDTDSLILPIMDYEFMDYPDLPTEYENLRPSFETTGSPSLPGGLNLGQQLHWQSHLLSPEEKSKTTVLMYPQYWAWRLTGEAVSEITSLGCHTDLWDIETNQATELLSKIGLGDALPPLHKAWEPIGTIKADLAEELGLPKTCKVLPGVHDSNAGYVPYLLHPKSDRPTVISTGTWSIVMEPNADISQLDPKRDMLANIDATGHVLATARYMGGREFSLICEALNTDIATTFVDADIQAIITSGDMVLPTFCHGTGPYPALEGQITGGKQNGKAAATLYSALMLTDILERLRPNAAHDIVIEGSFAANEVLCGLLAALNPKRRLRRDTSGSGVVEGCFLLTQWNTPPALSEKPVVKPYRVQGLGDYHKKWKAALAAKET